MPVDVTPVPPHPPRRPQSARRPSLQQAETGGGLQGPAASPAPRRQRPHSARLPQKPRDWNKLFRTLPQPPSQVLKHYARSIRHHSPAPVTPDPQNLSLLYPRQKGVLLPEAQVNSITRNCDMCAFVKDDLESFDRRRVLGKALSLTREKVIDFAQFTPKPPAVVSALYEQSMRRTSVLAMRLLHCDREELKRGFFSRMRQNGLISKQQFLALLRDFTKGESVGDAKDILSLYDSFERHLGGAVDFVTFFAFLDQCDNGTPPRERLAEAWGVMSREKQHTGLVHRFEWEAVLTALTDTGEGQALAASVNNVVKHDAVCPLYKQGWCSFTSLLRCVEDSAFLSSIFLTPRAPQAHVALKQALKEHIARKQKPDS